MNHPPYRIWSKRHQYWTCSAENPNADWFMYAYGLWMCDGSPVKEEEYAFDRFTGLIDKMGKPIYENDVVTFTIAGITHGPEPEKVGPVQVWWCEGDGCWAFGRWTETLTTSRAYDWWYTMADRIERGTLKVVGNVHEHPELLT